MKDSKRKSRNGKVVAVSGKRGMFVKKGSSKAGKRVASSSEITRELGRPLPSLDDGADEKEATRPVRK